MPANESCVVQAPYCTRQPVDLQQKRKSLPISCIDGAYGITPVQLYKTCNGVVVMRLTEVSPALTPFPVWSANPTAIAK